MNESKLIREAFEKNGGIFRMIPVFVPRRFSRAGQRLRLHPDDDHALGTQQREKELTIPPGQTTTITDEAAYGSIIVQGHGTFGNYDAEAAIMLRYGQLSADEYFVSEEAAKAGVRVSNHSRWEPLVMLKHFGPNHPEMPKAVPA